MTQFVPLHVQAVLSLEPILELVAALGRDLQADFLQLLRPTLSRLTALAEADGMRRAGSLTKSAYVPLQEQVRLTQSVVAQAWSSSLK